MSNHNNSPLYSSITHIQSLAYPRINTLKAANIMAHNDQLTLVNTPLLTFIDSVSLVVPSVVKLILIASALVVSLPSQQYFSKHFYIDHFVQDLVFLVVF